MCVCMHVHTCTCLHTHMHVHTHTHTHTHTCTHLKLSSGPPCNQQQITAVEDVAGRWTSFGQSLCLVVPGLRQLTDLVSSAERKWFFYVKYCE